MRKKGMIYLIVVLGMMCVLGAMTCAEAETETIITKDYFPPFGRTMTFSSLSGSSEVVITEGATSQCNFITDTVFGVNFPGSPHRFFNYRSDGYLMFYGSYSGSEYIYAPGSGKAEWLPNELEIGATYSVGWTRIEKRFSSSCPYVGSGSDSLSITVTGPYTEIVDCGTFETYKFDYVDRWKTSTGLTGVSRWTYWLAKDIGFVKMKYGNKSYELVSCSSCPPATPIMELSTEGTKVTISWTAPFADEYTLFYAPYPSERPIGKIHMEEKTSMSANLPEGSAYYVAIQASNDFGESGYSNIEFFEIE